MEGRDTLHQNRNRFQKRQSERNENLKTLMGVGEGEEWGGDFSPCDHLVYKTLLQSVSEALVNQRVADEGPSLAEGCLQLAEKHTHVTDTDVKNETSLRTECQ